MGEGGSLREKDMKEGYKGQGWEGIKTWVLFKPTPPAPLPKGGGS